MIRRLLSFLACLALATLGALSAAGASAAASWADSAFRAEIPGAEVHYFSIEGRSEPEWRASSVLAVIAAGGPEDTLAWTNWGAFASWYCDDGKVADISVDPRPVVFLPRLKDLQLSELPAWREYFQKIAQHEGHHVQIVLEHRGDYAGIDGTPCGLAMEKVNKIYGFIVSLNRQYDGE